jgi:hypothetical protein
MSASVERAALAARLEDGWQLIDAAVAAGQDTTRLEDFWVALLRQYEATFRRESSDISREIQGEGVARAS